ncbi:MAG: hypothetical protein LBS60_11380 [Deltaproteobacteria bacterium]|jgi:Tfp pilus tip-associated adhesin PilY1|nr:hypothetical protein [Deltaproteobacteria bacterium]
MKNIRTALVISLFSVLLLPKLGLAITADPSDYYVTPPLMVGGTKPAILMILSKDIKMFAPAYTAPADHDNDGTMDVGFNPAVEYTGLFDPYSCYTYEKGTGDVGNGYYTTDKGEPVKNAYDYTKRGHFVRVGASIEDDPDADGPYPDANRLDENIKKGYDDTSNGRPGYRAPKSKTGICPQRRNPGSAEKMNGNDLIWSGNWLNWITSSRIDVIRQVLYGGKRVVDTATSTYLAVESIPENAGVWGYDDFTKYYWLDYNEGSPYYDSLKYTPIDPLRWTDKYRRLHIYGRMDNRLYIIDNIWFMRQHEETLSHEGYRSYQALYPPRDKAHYLPIDYLLNLFADIYKTTELEVVVEACKPLTQKDAWDLYYGHILGRTDVKKYKGRVPSKKEEIPDSALLEAGDYCQRYGANYKPTGVIQKYTANDQALFGLLTGAFNDINRWDAGWLRLNVSSIRNHINSDGTFKGTSQDNVFRMLDAIVEATHPKLDPWKEKDKDGLPEVDVTMKRKGYGWQDPHESAFGNPIGEMLYQGLLYFAKTSKSSYASWPPSFFLKNTESVDLPRLGASGFDVWRSPLTIDSGDCLKPVILLLSDITTSHDGDMIPGTPHGLRSGGPPDDHPALTLNFPDAAKFHDVKGIGKTFNMNHYLKIITDIEGLSGKSFYIANLNTNSPGAVEMFGHSIQPTNGLNDTNLCVPRVLDNLANVRGICPSAPQTYGTYSVAAAAYYGNTHAFDGGMNSVQTYVVALPSIFPEINITVKGKTIAISPIAYSLQYPCGNNAEDGDRTYCDGYSTLPSVFSYLGPFATSVIQWRSNDANQVYSGALFAGFSSRLEGEGSDYQLDAPVRYYFDLIRECKPEEKCGQSLTGSARYKATGGNGGGWPSIDEERYITRAFLNQKKYTDKYDYKVASNTVTYRDGINGWSGTGEREVANKILLDFKDGRYAAARVKRRREFVYKNWDYAPSPAYIWAIERPKFFDDAAYTPALWSRIPASVISFSTELTAYYYPDPAQMEAYSLGFYRSLSATKRKEAMILLPGAADYSASYSGLSFDLVGDESASLFIDRPFTDIGYGEVMDVYGYIGDPGKIYKTIARPEEIDDAIGVVVFMYSLNAAIDGSDRDRPINIGYYIHGAVNYAESKEENPSRTLGVANGTYIEIQNEHNYMGGSTYDLRDSNTTLHKDRGLMAPAHELNTPPTCFRAGMVSFKPKNFTVADRDGTLFKNNKPANLAMPGFLSDTDATPHADAIPSCGSARLPLTATRFFRFPTSDAMSEHPTYLPNPLWLAAKYGGFIDLNSDGVPQKAEWDSIPSPNGDGVPDNYFYANNLSELKERLIEAFERIMTNLTVGTSSSASINSVMGGGITIRTYYQTIHTPYNEESGVNEVKWIGGAYSLFVDPYGNLREDTNQNGKLDLNCGSADEANSSRGPGAKGDWIVEFVNCSTITNVNASEGQKCTSVRDTSDLKSIVRVFPDQTGKNYVDFSRSQYLSLESVYTVWNLAENLAGLSNVSNRNVYFYDSETMGATPLTLGDGAKFNIAKAGSIYKQLMAADVNAASKLITYILGEDQAAFRSRKTKAPWVSNKGATVTCRLGDIINSQPVIIGTPFSGFDEMYNDSSFGSHRLKYSGRKNLAIMGANDGMLHAANLGTHVSFSQGVNGYDGADGQEVWAFIPQSVLPHLQWLAREDYAHSYYMDLTPFVAEVKDMSKPVGDQWRTIVYTSLRFGGRAIEVQPATNNTPAKYSYSEVFALDVTDTSKPPILLWRFTHPQLGLVVARPVVSRNDNEWRVLVGSGPTYDDYVNGVTIPGPDGRQAYRGYSNQSAKLFVFDALKGPGANNANVTVMDTDRPKSFIAQSFITIAPASSVKRDENGAVTWKNALAYFSVNQSAPDTALLCLKDQSDIDPYLSWNNPKDHCSPSNYGQYGYFDKGGVWRLNMAGAPSTWASNFKLFFDADRPVSGAVNATTDNLGNVWIIFGTGRYWSDDDSRICEGAGNGKECRLNHVNYLYGVKEPRDDAGLMTYATALDSSLTDVTNVFVQTDGNILVTGSGGSVSPSFSSGDSVISSYNSLSAHLASNKSGGYKKALHTGDVTSIDSVEINDPGDPDYKDTDWWKGLTTEMLIQQPAIAIYWGQSHMAFSTFLPENVACGSVGRSYHILLDTYTGLPSPAMGSDEFLSYNRTQDMPEVGGNKVVSDHYGFSDGMNVATTVVTTYINGRAKTAFVTTTSSGEGGSGNQRHTEKDDPLLDPDGNSLTGDSLQSYVEPVWDSPKGVVSWREVLDHTILFTEE